MKLIIIFEFPPSGDNQRRNPRKKTKTRVPIRAFKMYIAISVQERSPRFASGAVKDLTPRKPSEIMNVSTQVCAAIIFNFQLLLL